jgi:LDH2 family malate/lactate/ureidoglycolate dehydrogenase
MARYPGSERERRFAVDTLRDGVAAIFGACGMPQGAAWTLADSLVGADLQGIHSHGVLRVPDYVGKLTREGVDPKGAPRLVTDNGAALVVDGGNAMGQVAGVFAMDAAIERARTVNLALAAVRGSNHCGTMEYYTRRAAAAGMIGLAGTDAIPTMAPWGGLDKIIGLNPLSVAMPTPSGEPFVLDVALGATAHGKIRVYAQKGEPIPEGWAFDAEGRPTTDAQAALTGLIQPIGAFKGLGLAMAVGLLSTLLSGAAYGTELGNMVDGPRPGQDGQFYMAINIAAFVDPAEFAARMDTALTQIRTSRKAEGVERIYAPGDLEAELRAAYTADGIPLNDETIAGLREACEGLGVKAGWL